MAYIWGVLFIKSGSTFKAHQWKFMIKSSKFTKLGSSSGSIPAIGGKVWCRLIKKINGLVYSQVLLYGLLNIIFYLYNSWYERSSEIKFSKYLCEILILFFCFENVYYFVLVNSKSQISENIKFVFLLTEINLNK